MNALAKFGPKHILDKKINFHRGLAQTHLHSETL